MSLITYGFYSGLRIATELKEFKINLIDRELIRFKKIVFERKFNIIEREILTFKVKENEKFVLKKEKEQVKWKIL